MTFFQRFRCWAGLAANMPEKPEEHAFSPLTPQQRQILDRLTAVNFPGKAEVVQQLVDCQGRVIDEDGSFALEPKSPVQLASKVVCRVVTEGEFTDTDGVPVYLLLHVVEGVATELEIYKADGALAPKVIAADQIEVWDWGDYGSDPSYRQFVPRG